MAQKSEFEERLRLESELARRLLEADENTRAKLYGPVLYDRIYEISLRRRGPEAEDQQFGSAPCMFLILTRLSKPGDQVLEVGCGCGYLSLELARSGRQMTGVDVSSVAIGQAKRHAERLPSGAPEFVCVSGLDLPFPCDSFDLVFSRWRCLHDLREAPLARLNAELDQLMDDAVLRAQFATRAVEARERFSLERIAGVWDELFAEVRL